MPEPKVIRQQFVVTVLVWVDGETTTASVVNLIEQTLAPIHALRFGPSDALCRRYSVPSRRAVKSIPRA